MLYEYSYSHLSKVLALAYAMSWVLCEFYELNKSSDWVDPSKVKGIQRGSVSNVLGKC
jgi:hypothetical protein